MSGPCAGACTRNIVKDLNSESFIGRLIVLPFFAWMLLLLLLLLIK